MQTVSFNRGRLNEPELKSRCLWQSNLMLRNFKLLFLPLDFVVSSVERWGRLGGGEGKTPHPPLTPPIKGGGKGRRRSNLMLRNFKVFGRSQLLLATGHTALLRIAGRRQETAPT